MEETDAIRNTEESITSIDFLIDGTRQVYINQMKLELAQWSLIILLVGYSDDTLADVSFRPARQRTLFIAVVVAGFNYLGLYHNQSSTEGYMSKMGFINFWQCKKRGKLVWILWAVFATISLLANTALFFGSNFWLSRKISIDGQYALPSYSLLILCQCLL